MHPFFKYHGAGNDFVMIDNRDNSFCTDESYIHLLCNRRLGIGSDGLITINNSNEIGIDFQMQYFNADGKEGSMCGNGGRCAVWFAHQLGMIKQNTTFRGIDGIHSAQIISSQGKNAVIALQMIDVENITPYQQGYFLNTGSPHVVMFVEDVINYDVIFHGNKIRYDNFFTNGTNVNFVQINKDNSVFVRTFERGVEDETLSCGTGVTASALVVAMLKNIDNQIALKTRGGDFVVRFSKNKNNFNSIFLQGPVCEVFEGKI